MTDETKQQIRQLGSHLLLVGILGICSIVVHSIEMSYNRKID